ncbi:hypothetical protein ACFYU9_23955 [Streptomyces sp. NPDC004327]
MQGRIVQPHEESSLAVSAFDLFSMTHHVECVAILEPAKKDA